MGDLTGKIDRVTEEGGHNKVVIATLNKGRVASLSLQILKERHGCHFLEEEYRNIYN